MPPLTLHLKRLGKQRVRTVSYPVEAWPATFHELLCTCVRAEVMRYNTGQRGEAVLPYLLPAEIDTQLHTRGRVTFNDPAEKRLVEAEPCIDAALLALKDGLFAAFVDDTELTAPEQPLHLNPESVVTFIRLTFLAGSPW